MKRPHAPDLLSPPGLLTLVRVPLAAAFPLVVGSRVVALCVLVVAAISDVLDGWCARRTGRASVTGAIVDPIVDKLFVGSVALTLLATERIGLLETLLLGSRDLVELPLLVQFLFTHRGAIERTERLKANVFGKAVTVLQFVTVVSALFGARSTAFLALSTGAAGLVAGASYWARACSRRTTRHGGESRPFGNRFAGKAP